GRVDDMLKVKGVMVYPSAVKDVVNGFVPRTTGEIRVVLDKPGPRVEPPLKVKVEHAPGLAGQALDELREDLRARIQQMLKVNPDIILVPPQSLARSQHKGRLIEKAYEQAPPGGRTGQKKTSGV
ncbi:MAG: hypothetical protein JRJ59_01225, partial [Deltaproteobacteria bacterium]|nr:hypothetical protein [Deltaproteobacteria bacterium]